MDLKADSFSGHLGCSRKKPRRQSHSLPVEGKLFQKSQLTVYGFNQNFPPKKKREQTKNTLTLTMQVMCALDTGVFCQEMLRLVQFLPRQCTNKEAAGKPISYVLCSEHRLGTQHCSPEAEDSGWEKSISAKSHIQNCSTKSLGSILVKKSENIITYSTPAVSHALSVFSIFMALVFHHSCQCLPYSH